VTEAAWRAEPALAKMTVNREFCPPAGRSRSPDQGTIMRHHIFALALIVPVLVSGAALARDTPLDNIPLKWTPTSSLASMGTIDVSGAMLTTKIHVEPLVDARQNPTLIAENREKADKVKPVTTSGDVAAFISDHLKESMRGAGMSIVDAGADLNISGEIRQFFVTEVDTYRGEMSLLIHVKNAAGKELWTGIVGGGAEHFGRSYSAENYYETLSDMVLRASYNLLSTAGFRAAVQNH
jgi:hypothetical protein